MSCAKLDEGIEALGVRLGECSPQEKQTQLLITVSLLDYERLVAGFELH